MQGVLIDVNRAKGSFIYAVSGTDEEIERYVAAKGEYIRYVESGPHAGKPKYFTKFPAGRAIKLKFSTNENVYVDNQETDLLVGVVNGFGDTQIGKALASEAAKVIMKQAMGKTTIPSVEPETEPDKEVVKDEDLDNG